MSVLFMVRHAQASVHTEDYDQLSGRGQEQARLLGDYWAERKLAFDQVFVGPRRRHRQTLERIAAVYQEHGLPWPQTMELAELDEYPGQRLLQRALPELSQADLALTAPAPGDDAASAQRRYMKLFQKVTRDWARGEVRVPELESWQEFRARVEGALQKIKAVDGRKKRIAVFTSGGPVAAAMGLALGLDDEKTLELSWLVRNSACSEFLFTTGRFSVSIFNGHPHLATSDLLTYI